MQELLAKIIEMDANARRIREQAEKEKLSSEDEIEVLRQKIYDDYITRAKDRVEKNISIDRHNAEEEFAEYEEQVSRLTAQMQEAYAAYGDRWVDEIVNSVING